jgi:oligopeptide transport system permease protein
MQCRNLIKQVKNLKNMSIYIAKRCLIAIATLLAITIVLFLLLRLMPGTPFNDEKLSDEQIAVLYTKYGLDRSYPEQILLFIKNMLTGDFGVSYAIQANYPISTMLLTRFPITIRVGIQGYVIGLLAGLILGISAALFHNGVLDSITTLFSMVGSSVPAYVLALGLVYALAFKAGIFPLMYSQNRPIVSTILPSLAMAFGPMAATARLTRSEMIEVMNAEYISLAETKGLGRYTIIVIHGLRNALIPLITTSGPMLIGMITGSTVIENIFSIPGIGNLFVTAIQSNDYNVVMSLAFIFSALSIAMLLIVDILYGIADPRIRVAGEKSNG